MDYDWRDELVRGMKRLYFYLDFERLLQIRRTSGVIADGLFLLHAMGVDGVDRLLVVSPRESLTGVLRDYQPPELVPARARNVSSAAL